MRIQDRILFAILALLTVASPALAQPPSPLVGAWERFSFRNADGTVGQPPLAAAFVIFSADGYYSQTSVPTGRNKVNKPLDQLSREELLDRFRNVSIFRGKYTISGTRLTRTFDSVSDPNQEGGQAVQDFRLDGDVLILSGTAPGSQQEARFRRVK
jgi:hypothetical protein